MRLRKLALAVGLASALSAEVASALGLGGIKLNSSLNQPLDAEIKLLQARDLSSKEILVNLASKMDFQRAGVDRLYFLSGLRFQVVVDSPTGPYVHVTSKQVIREPYLNFLLETQWPSGRILREYTLLLDLPVFNDQSPKAVNSAQSPALQPVATPQPKAQPVVTEPAPRPTSTQRSSAQGDNVYGPVGDSDTLWRIALRVRPGRQVSVQQTMLAIQRLNPDAFINGNINLLRKGQVLRVPTARDINAVSGRQAVSEVAFQNSKWSEGSDTQPMAAQLEASKRIDNKVAEPTVVEGRVKLASASSNESAVQGQGQGATESDGVTEALQNELAISQEELDKVSRDNSELRDRISDLEEQMQTMERLVEVSNQQMRALQLASKESASEAITETTAPEPVAAPVPAPSEPVVAAKAEPQKAVKMAAKPAEKSLFDMLMDNLLYIFAGIVALGAAAFLVMRRRQQAQENDSEAVDLESYGDSYNEDEEDLSLDEQELEEEDSDLYDQDIDLDELDELDEEDNVAAESQTDDAVGEADIYIAYGKLDQAEEILLNALDNGNYDDEDELRLKLLEVYSEADDLQKFDTHYALLMGGENTDVQSQATKFRSKFVGAPEFVTSDLDESVNVGDSAGDGLLDDGFDLDLSDMDLSAEPSDDAEVDFSADIEDEFTLDVSEDEVDDGLSFDLSDEEDTEEGDELDIDIQFDDELESADDSTTEAEDEISLDLDFELPEGVEDIAFDDIDEQLNADLEGLELPETGLESLEFEESGESEPATLQESADKVDFDEADVNFDLDMDEDFGSLDSKLEELETSTDLVGQEFEPQETLTEEKVVEDSNLEPAEFDELAIDDLDDSFEGFDNDFSDIDDELDALESSAAADLGEDFTADVETEAKPEFEHELEIEVDSEQEPEFDLAADLGLDDSDFLELDDDQDDGFVQSVSDLPTPEDVLELEDTAGDELSDDLDFLADTDEASTKLDLARAYIDMGDNDGAKDILDEVVAEGTDEQRQDAEELIKRMS